MARVIGIDLGTTYSAVAVIGATGKPEILPNREGERITASVVQFLGEETLVGSSAKRSAPTAPQDVVQFVKRHMGEPQWRFVASDGASYGAEQVSAIILRRLKEDAETALGEPVSDVVITVPAFFGDAMRTATKDAGRIAGLNVLRIINEPTAAALAYGLDGGADGTVLVYDLGGGTFDVTLMRLGAGSLEVVATSGDRNLGGYDWDNALMSHANAIVQEQGGPDLYDDDLLTAELRDKCELAKRSLTTTASAKFFITAGGRTATVQVTREDFEGVTRSLLNRTLDITSSLLEEAGVDWPQVDRVLLVGGSTHMPMVRQAVAALSGKEPQRTVNPDEAVALGAAIQAHLAADAAAAAGAGAAGMASAGQPELAGMRGRTVVVHDVNAHGIGTLALLEDTEQMRNFVLVKANTRVPAYGSDDFQTVEENQRRLKVQITEGDDPDPDYVRVVGDGVFSMPPYPKGAPIRISVAFDIDGVIFAEVFDGTTDRKLGDMEIARAANLTPEQVAEAIETMRKLGVN